MANDRVVITAARTMRLRERDRKNFCTSARRRPPKLH